MATKDDAICNTICPTCGSVHPAKILCLVPNHPHPYADHDWCKDDFHRGHEGRSSSPAASVHKSTCASFGPMKDCLGPEECDCAALPIERWKVVKGDEADSYGIAREVTPAPFIDIAQMVDEDDAREIVDAHNRGSMPQSLSESASNLYLGAPLPAPSVGYVSDQLHEGPSCTVCGAAMQFKCLSCGSTPACTEPAPVEPEIIRQWRDPKVAWLSPWHKEILAYIDGLKGKLSAPPSSEARKP